jgi:hypothetical protein
MPQTQEGFKQNNFLPKYEEMSLNKNEVPLVTYAGILKAACRYYFNSLPANNKCGSMAFHQYDAFVLCSDFFQLFLQ